jgi:hypothetical protein
MAEHYTAMAPEQRAKTLVIEPSREGRDRLTGLIRENLAAKGELSSSGLTFESLEAKGLTRAETREAASFAIGDIVRFTRDYAAKGVSRARPCASWASILIATAWPLPDPMGRRSTGIPGNGVLAMCRPMRRAPWNCARATASSSRATMAPWGGPMACLAR